MSIRAGRWWLTAVLCLALAGCAQSGDAAVRAVDEARSAVVVARTATRLLLDDRSTAPYTQVVLSDALDAVAEAGQGLREASEDDRERTARARRALRDAEAAIDELADAGAAGLDAAALHRLDTTVRELDAALVELRR